MIHIQRYIDRIQGFEARGTQDFMMSMKDAKDLHADITKLLLTLETLREQKNNPSNNEVINIDVTGGSF